MSVDYSRLRKLGTVIKLSENRRARLAEYAVQGDKPVEIWKIERLEEEELTEARRVP